MASSTSRAVPMCNCFALGLGVVLLAAPASALASDPDIPHLEADAERGSIRHEVELGAAYFAGRGVPQDDKRAAYWYEKAANAGDPFAQNQIGYFYHAGIGVTRDPAQAVRWFQRAFAGGLVSAKVNVGVAYLLGDGVRKDPALAENLFRQAFAQGNGMGACYLGEMYIHALGVGRDEAAGERWYEAGARLHDAPSEFQLANLLWKRQRNGGEAKRAIKLWRESSAGGMVAAKHQLGIILVNHPELAASPREAPARLKEAAEAGEWRSSIALGLLSRDGKGGVAVDPAAAYYHYRLAALQGGDEALKVVANDLDAISGRLGPQQTASIDAEARTWFENHHIALEFVNKEGAKGYPEYAMANREEGVHAGPSMHIELPAGPLGQPIRRPFAQ